MDFDSYYRTMFTGLGKIFPNLPRQAENADTREDIRRHDPDQEKKKKGREGGASETAQNEDYADVSVEALRVFLENFLGEQLNTGEKSSPSISSSETPAGNSPPPVANKMTQAVNAYQTTARSQKKSSPPPAESTSAAPQLQTHEVRTIHQLLRDLKDVSARNIEYLRIERSDSFLNSLVAAVEKARNS